MTTDNKGAISRDSALLTKLARTIRDAHEERDFIRPSLSDASEIERIADLLAAQPAQADTMESAADGGPVAIAWMVNGFAEPELFTDSEEASKYAMTIGKEVINLCDRSGVVTKRSFCMGRNCGSTDGKTHSLECLEDYELATGMRNAYPHPAHDWRAMLAPLVDIYDDGQNNAPENRCYVEGAWKECIDEARAALFGVIAPVPTTGFDALKQKGLDEHLARVLQQGKNEDGWKGDPDVAAVPGEGATPCYAPGCHMWDGTQRCTCTLSPEVVKPGMADYYVDGKPVSPKEFIRFLRDRLVALETRSVPAPKLYGSQDEDAHETRCAYVDGWNECRQAVMAISAPVAPEPIHASDAPTDDAYVMDFAEVMKAKMARSREKGRGSWQDCSPDDLSRMLREHVEKGDPVDVANFCMMLYHLGKQIAARPAPAVDAVPGTPTLRDDEIEEFKAVIEDFEDNGETAVDYVLLMDWARRGLLECTHFEVTKAGREALDVAKATKDAAKGDAS